MRSGQGCIYTCTLPGDARQVRQLLASLTQELEVLISLILSDDEAVESIWCVCVCFFSLWASFVVKLVDLNLSLSPAIWFIVRTMLSVALSRSVRFCDEKCNFKGVVVKMILQAWFPSYCVGRSTREAGLMDVFGQNLIGGRGSLL